MPTTANSMAVGARAAATLCRPGLSLTVALAAAAGALLAPAAEQAAVAFCGVLLLAAGCSALNQVQERDQDRLCARTRNRPLPSGVLQPATARVLAGSLLAGGFAALLVFSADRGCAAWALAAVILYNGVYTPLKRHSAVAFLPGAVAGALPPVIGAAAAGALPPAVVVLAGTILVWQMPHYWLVQLRHRDDYQGFPFPAFCRTLSTGQLRRLVFSWSVAFAVLPPVLVLLVGGGGRPALPGCALALSGLLTAAGLPLLGRKESAALYGRLEVLLRMHMLALIGLVALASRTLA